MRPDAFSQHQRFIQVGDTRVAYLDHGEGPPLLLLHGCPFSCFVWRKTIPLLSARYRCIAPDLLGLGDTHTPPEADWSLPAQAATVLGLLDALQINAAHLVGHDHGAAVAQLLAADHPHRIRRLVITNAEAYDNWPSHQELPFLRLAQLPLVGTLALSAWSKRPVLRLALRTGRAVHNPAVLTPELLDGYIRANLADRQRRAKTRRFLAGQLDPANQRHTLAALAGLRRFDHPTLLIWGRDDPHFGPQWAQRLHADIPGAHQLEFLPATGHLLMEEQPERLAALIADFLAEPHGPPPHQPPAPNPAAYRHPNHSSCVSVTLTVVVTMPRATQATVWLETEFNSRVPVVGARQDPTSCKPTDGQVRCVVRLGTVDAGGELGIWTARVAKHSSPPAVMEVTVRFARLRG